MRLSHPALLLLKACADRAPERLHGYQLMQLTGVSSGTMYPILLRFEKEGLLASAWEEIDPITEGRPRRRLYRITSSGQRLLAERLGALGVGVVA